METVSRKGSYASMILASLDTTVLIILFHRVELYYTIAFGYIRYHHLSEDGVCTEELIDQ